MKILWVWLGRAAFWLAWPLLWLYLHGSRRTRLLVMCDGKILVEKGWLGDGKWLLPGGGLSKGEDPDKGAVRELAEETGLVLPPEQLRACGQQKVRAYGLSYEAVFFVCEIDQPAQLKLARLEIIEARWLSPRQLNKANAAGDTLLGLALIKSKF